MKTLILIAVLFASVSVQGQTKPTNPGYTNIYVTAQQKSIRLTKADSVYLSQTFGTVKVAINCKGLCTIRNNDTADLIFSLLKTKTK